MEVKIVKEEKNLLEVQVDNLTVVELLRNYLNNEENVKMVAWKREHPFKSPVLHIEMASGDAKKALQKAIAAAEKDVEKLEEEFKKMK